MRQEGIPVSSGNNRPAAWGNTTGGREGKSAKAGIDACWRNANRFWGGSPSWPSLATVKCKSVYFRQVPYQKIQWMAKTLSKIIWQPFRGNPKIVLKTAFHRFNPGKFPLSVAKMSHWRHDSTNFPEKVKFLWILEIPLLFNKFFVG